MQVVAAEVQAPLPEVVSGQSSSSRSTYDTDTLSEDRSQPVEEVHRLLSHLLLGWSREVAFRRCGVCRHSRLVEALLKEQVPPRAYGVAHAELAWSPTAGTAQAYPATPFHSRQEA